MKALKILLIILAIVAVAAVGLYIYGTTVPEQITVERSTTIDRSPEVVFNEVNDFRNWAAWSPWDQRDTTIQATYSGNEKGEGSVRSWTSENSGAGSQEITLSEPHSLIETSMTFEGQGSAESYWKFDGQNGSTNVTWGFEMEESSPFSRGIMALFVDIEEMVGKDYEEGLQNLKEVVESKPKTTYSIDITEEETNEMHYVGTVTSLEGEAMYDMGNAYEQAYGKIMNYMQSHKIEMAGLPICIYHEYDSTKVVFEPAMPVSQLPSAKADDISTGTLPSFKVVKGVHKGDYSQLTQSYSQLESYIAEKGYTVSGNVWEEYVTDPMEEKDTSKWVTNIYFPVN